MNNFSVFYINLEKRKDRREHIEKQLNFLPNVIRIEAIEHSIGSYGCCLSHIKALKEAYCTLNEYSIIFEDDHIWELPNKDVVEQLERLSRHDFNVTLLSYNFRNIKLFNHCSYYSDIENGQTTSAYIIKKSYIPNLLEKFEESSRYLTDIKNIEKYSIDQHWKSLQKRDNWKASIPRLGKQLKGVSDIFNKEIYYGGTVFIAIISCKKYLNRKLKHSMINNSFPYRYFIGDIDENECNDVVYLKCPDNYESLPIKVCESFKWIRKNYPEVDYIFKTDDDISINFNDFLKTFYEISLKRINFCGKVVNLKKSCYTTWHYGKCENKSLEQPFLRCKTKYCQGAGYFLSSKAVDIFISHENDVRKEHIFEDYAVGRILQYHKISPRKINMNFCYWKNSNKIVIKIMGGLGNQLFQVFAGMSYAFDNQLDYVIDDQTSDGRKICKIFNVISSSIYHCPQKNIYKEKEFHYQPIPNKKCSFMIDGYFQSYKYFEKNFNIICKILNIDTLRNERRMSIKKEIISIHFRFDDYLKLKEYFIVQRVDYYIEALRYFSPDDQTLLFFYQQSDTVMAKEYIQAIIKETNFEYKEIEKGLKDWEEMLYMSNCSHNIIANSTFSWWGAYLNDNPYKKVIYPKGWFGPSYKQNDTKDLFPLNWICV